MGRSKKAKIIAQTINKYAPMAAKWLDEETWIKVIEEGFYEIEKAETLRAATPRESRY